MRLITYKYMHQELAGVIIDEKVYPLADILEISPITSLFDLIALYVSRGIQNAEQIVVDKKIVGVDLSDVKLLAPITNPFRNIICVGKNYADHAKEVQETKLQTQDENMIPTSPVFFTKNTMAVIGDGETIQLHPELTEKVDYEVELAVIIGKLGKNIKPEDVESYILGYTILNDVTARDLQVKHGQWFYGKSLDTFCPFGPVIVTKDEIGFPVELDIICRVNGEIRQHSNTKNFIFDINTIVSTLSKGMTLFPGDIIATGTPAGIGHAMKPPVYLKSGDKVECEIEKIGVLTNYCQ